jgi:hypothetical protein
VPGSDGYKNTLGRQRLGFSGGDPSGSSDVNALEAVGQATMMLSKRTSDGDASQARWRWRLREARHVSTAAAVATGDTGRSVVSVMVTTRGVGVFGVLR